MSAVPWFDTGRHCPVELLLSYARAMLLLQAAEALVEGAAGIVSLRGSVMDPNNRRWCAAPLAYVRAVLSALELLGTRNQPGWVSLDQDKRQISVLSQPERKQIDVPVQEQLIVELYSK